MQDAGICQSIAEVDFIEIHAFGCQPKSPNPLLDPEGFAAEQQRLYQSYRETYAKWFKENCPDNGVPARFTVHVVDVPDKAASYEFYGTALYQKSLHEADLIGEAQANPELEQARENPLPDLEPDIAEEIRELVTAETDAG